jgi:hypothetical protein
LYEPVDIAATRHVRKHAETVAAQSNDFALGFLERLSILYRRNHHSRAFASERERDRAADSPAPAGYDRYLSVEFAHGFP